MSGHASDEQAKAPKPLANPAKQERVLVGETVVLGDSNAPVNGFTVPFSIRSSHDVNSVGFSGQNTISWPVPFNQSDLEVNGIRPLLLEITRTKLDEYLLKVTGKQQLNEPTALELASTLELHLTFLLNRQNPNPHYGTFFVRLDLQDFRSLRVGSGLHITDSLAIRTEGRYQTELDDWKNIAQSDLLEYYAEGSRTSESKSKYFQWFRIIEMLEGSTRYRNRMGWTQLFSGAEQNLLGAIADFLGNERKRAIIRSMFSRTTQARHEKLALFLSELGITEYIVGGNRTPVSPEKLNEIIQARNNLFHAGSNFDEKILWQHLFPLVTAIANAAHMKPLVL